MVNHIFLLLSLGLMILEIKSLKHKHLAYNRADTSVKTMYDKFWKNYILKLPLALDCQVVYSSGKKKPKACIARVTLVNINENVIFDKLIKPDVDIEDYRTHITGLTKLNLMTHGIPLHDVRKAVKNLVRFKVLVGHMLYKDLNALEMKHSFWFRRDSALSCLFRNKTDNQYPLKVIAKTYLNKDIQTGLHSTIEDATTMMQLYKKFRVQWDAEVIFGDHSTIKETSNNTAVAIDIVKLNVKFADGRIKKNIARVTIIDSDLVCLYDEFIAPNGKIVDYETKETGIYPKYFATAISFKQAEREVRLLVDGKILVGYDLFRTTEVFKLHHTFNDRRDCCSYPKFFTSVNPLFTDVVQCFLGTILTHPLTTVKNSQAAMKLYLKYKQEWDSDILLQYKRFLKGNKPLPGQKREPLSLNCQLKVVQTQRGPYTMLKRVTIVNNELKCIYDKSITFSSEECAESLPFNDIYQVKNVVEETVFWTLLIGDNLNECLSVLSLKVNKVHCREVKEFASAKKVNSLEELCNIYFGSGKSVADLNDPIEKGKVMMKLYLKTCGEWDSFIYKQNENFVLGLIDKYLQQPTAIHGQFIELSPETVLLVRVALVNASGVCIYNTHIKPALPQEVYEDKVIKNKEVHWSELQMGEDYNTVVDEIANQLKNSTIIGFGLLRTLKQLHFKSKWWFCRDVYSFSKFRTETGTTLPVSALAEAHLKYTMTKPNDPEESAKVLMQLYLKYKPIWDVEVMHRYRTYKEKSRLRKKSGKLF